LCVDVPGWPDDAGWRVQRALSAAHAGLPCPASGPVEVSVLLTGDKRQKELNRLWRGKNTPTNVLSFPDGDTPGSPGQPFARAYPDLMESKQGSNSLSGRVSEPDNRDHLSWKRSLSLPGRVSEPDNRDHLSWKRSGGLKGDISLALETLKREAAAQEKTFDDHFSHMLVHGFLHLAGYDHQEAVEADQMERLEIDILSGLAIPNPYADTHTEQYSPTT